MKRVEFYLKLNGEARSEIWLLRTFLKISTYHSNLTSAVRSDLWTHHDFDPISINIKP